MQEILNHTQPYAFNWSKSLNDYTSQKRALEWGMNPLPVYISEKQVKQNDRDFNPILQIYKDKSKESALRITEKTNLIEAIAKNTDCQLQKEQTFNIINLRDRLKGFENDPNYPTPKAYVPRAKDVFKNKISYNILSNRHLSEHHYDKPENRPKTEVNQPLAKPATRSYSSERDYDIISNKYKEYNEEKMRTDKEINKIQTAKLFYKKNDYNPVKGSFFDASKEATYQWNRKEREKTWGQENFKQKPQCAKGQSDLYNLINMKVVNADELKLADEKEHNKKKRYELKVVIEDYNREKSLQEMQKKEAALNNKCSYQKYKEIDNRNYDIIDLKDIPFKKHFSVVKRDTLTHWEKIVNNSGMNNTFGNKEIYRDTYDYSDNALNYDRFTKGRLEKLNKLPKIDKDEAFNIKVCFAPKVNVKDNTEVVKSIAMDKKQFFLPPKNVFRENQSFKIITRNNEMNKKSEIVEEIKEKNMRNYSKEKMC